MRETNEQEPEDHGEVVPRPRARISWAWVFPVLAAAATAWLFWSNWRQKGPVIEIQFDSAPGIEAGRTPLLYRGVTAGKVTEVRLDAALKKAVVVVRLQEFAAKLGREGSVFWIDQPAVGIGNVTGLESLIQGHSIEARMGDGPPATHFVGRDRAPLTPMEFPALTLKLRAPNIPLVDRGSPVFYHGVTVGNVEDKELDSAGHPYLNVAIEKKFAGTVRRNARFWPVAAASLKVGSGGVKVDLPGLKALLAGGVEFEVFGPPGDAVKDEGEFTLFANQSAARATGDPVRISFRGGEGIQPGQTEVRYLGVPVGYVESATLDVPNRAVVAVARFQPAFDRLHDQGAVFTLVGPRISLAGVTGLETLLSGPYVDLAPGGGNVIADRFEGRSLADEGFRTTQAESEGVRVVLHAKVLPPLREGAPVLYRGLVAGRVEKAAMGTDGPVLAAVIRKDFAASVGANTRFWQVPAVSLQAGPGVFKVDVAGVETLLQGGVAFDAFEAAGPSANDGAKFELFATEFAARAVSPPVRITFENGQGLLAGQTQVRYLGLPVGLVEAVTAKGAKVEAVVRLQAEYGFLRRRGSAFSIARLNVSLKGISGLETMVSGVYIDCVPAPGGGLAESFDGVSTAQATLEKKAETGLEIVVTATQTNIDVDAPVTYRGLKVGRVERKILLADRGKVGLCLVIDPAHAGLVRENTKFWDAGGLRVGIGFFAFKVPSASLETLARGGLAFATPDEAGAGAAVARGHEFELNASPRREWLRWRPDEP